MRRKKLNGEKIFSIVITCAIVLTLCIGVISVLRTSQKNSSNENNIVDLNQTKADVAQNQTQAPTIVMRQTESETKTQASSNQAVASPTGASAKYSFSEKDTLKWPIKGNVVIKYSMDSTVLFKTLGQYKVNPAIIISANAGDSVVAAASGVVTAVSKNDETGYTVTIDIGSGYVTTYGQLDSASVTLKKGSTVVAGDKIGKIAQPTKYYTQEGTNLYFKLTKDSKPVDPTQFLEQ